MALKESKTLGKSVSFLLRKPKFWGENVSGSSRGRILYVTGEEDPWIRYNKGLGTHTVPLLLLEEERKYCLFPCETNRIMYFCTHCCKGDCYNVSMTLNVSCWRGGERWSGPLIHAQDGQRKSNETLLLAVTRNFILAQENKILSAKVFLSVPRLLTPRNYQELRSPLHRTGVHQKLY